MPSSFQPFVFAAVLALPGLVAAQTLRDGIDAPAEVGEFTTEALYRESQAPIPTGVWQYTNAHSHDGVDSVVSVLPGETESYLQTTLQGPATVSFWWKIHAEYGFDTLACYTRNGYVKGIDPPFVQGSHTPTSSDWIPVTFQVDPGEQPLIWQFKRLASQPGTGQAWIDKLSVVPIPDKPELREAVDMENDDYALYSTDWVKSDKEGAENNNVARSGDVPNGERSTMMFEVQGPAVISFDWGVISDTDYPSNLQFYVDGSPYAVIEGTVDLEPKSFNLRPGRHSLKFEFNNNFNTPEDYGGSLMGYVDKLEISAYGESADLANAVDRASGVYSRSWYRTNATHRDGIDSAAVMAPVPYRTEMLYIELPKEAGLLHFWTKTEADASGTLFVYVDNSLVVQRSGVQGWARTELNLPARTSPRLMEAFLHRTADLDENSPNTKVYLDSVVFEPGATNYQPDLSIGVKGKALRGEKIVNRSGARQISTVKTRWTKPYGQYRVGGKNTSSTDKDTIQFRGVGSRRHHKVTFVVKEGKKLYNFTAAFLAGKFTSLELDPGKYERHEIWIVRKKKSKRRSVTLTTVGTSKTDPRKVDAVRTRLVVMPWRGQR